MLKIHFVLMPVIIWAKTANTIGLNFFEIYFCLSMAVCFFVFFKNILRWGLKPLLETKPFSLKLKFNMFLPWSLGLNLLCLFYSKAIGFLHLPHYRNLILEVNCCLTTVFCGLRWYKNFQNNNTAEILILYCCIVFRLEIVFVFMIV